MAEFIKGDVVVIEFPYTDFTQTKRRPSLVLANLIGDDIVLCQITSQQRNDPYAIPIVDSDFEEGSLTKNSNVRPNRIFTADKGIIIRQVGHLKSSKINEVIEKVIEILTQQ